MGDYTLLHGDCLDAMAAMDAGSVDAVVTDPPYLLGFMGKEWDKPRAAQVWHNAWAAFAFRTLRPSCYMVAFGGTRTWHRLACAIEDAGFEIRDTLMWLYGSGFPKGKSCLKPAWEPIILARKPGPMRELGIEECRIAHDEECKPMAAQSSKQSTYQQAGRHEPCLELKPAGRWPANLILECTCDETREGTAKTGTHVGHNRDGSQVSNQILGARRKDVSDGGYGDESGKEPVRIHTDPNCPCAMLDGQTGTLKSPSTYQRSTTPMSNVYGTESRLTGATMNGIGDSGGASRFFLNVKQECDLCASPADSAASSSTTTPATLDTSAPTLAPNWQVEQLAQDAKSAASLCDSCATAIARSLAATPPGSDPEHQAGLASISALGERTLTRSLALYVAALASTGTTPTTASPSLWSGCVRDATRGSIPIDDAENARDLSRFRYVSKASRSERNAGCEGMPLGDPPGSKRATPAEGRTSALGRPRANHHPTVKPLALMRWLVKLVAQPGDVVLDPFMGSGTTGVACAMEGREFIGIEREAEYVEISRRRIDHASAQGRLPLDESPPLAPVAGRPT